MTIEVAIRRLSHGADLPLPAYATAQSAGVDLLAAIRDDMVIAPAARALVPTGVAIALPEGFEAQIRPRSGLAAKNGVTLLNSPGTIDADYRGEIQVLVVNLGADPFTVSRGMRIAQMVVAPVSRLRWREAEVLPGSVRGEGGFGSTGHTALISS